MREPKDQQVQQIAYVGDGDPYVGTCPECDYTTGKNSQTGALKALTAHYEAKHEEED